MNKYTNDDIFDDYEYDFSSFQPEPKQIKIDTQTEQPIIRKIPKIYFDLDEKYDEQQFINYIYNKIEKINKIEIIIKLHK